MQVILKRADIVVSYYYLSSHAGRLDYSKGENELAELAQRLGWSPCCGRLDTCPHGTLGEALQAAEQWLADRVGQSFILE